MSFLLDTNVCVTFLRTRASPVVERLAATRAADVFLCSIVKAELYYGAQRGGQVESDLPRLIRFWSQFNSLPFDAAAAEAYGLIRHQLFAAGTPIGPNDLLIAAIAVANHLTIVTHNTREFGRVQGLQLEDWEAA